MIWGFAEDYKPSWTGQAIQQVNEALIVEANIGVTYVLRLETIGQVMELDTSYTF